jgi:hypothetical protein
MVPLLHETTTSKNTISFQDYILRIQTKNKAKTNRKRRSDRITDGAPCSKSPPFLKNLWETHFVWRTEREKRDLGFFFFVFVFLLSKREASSLGERRPGRPAARVARKSIYKRYTHNSQKEVIAPSSRECRHLSAQCVVTVIVMTYV